MSNNNSNNEINSTTLSNYRLEKSKSDLETAEILLNNDKISQSINISYYSMFHATRALLAIEKFDSKKHSSIISYFNRHFIKSDKIKKEFSKMLMEAQDFRNESDYDDFYIISKEEAIIQLENANKFYNMIEKYIQDNKK